MSSSETQFYPVFLYNVTETRIRDQRRGLTPPEQRIELPIKKTKDFKIKDVLSSIVLSPLIFTEDKLVGSSIFTVPNRMLKKQVMQWFDLGIFSSKHSTILPIEQSFKIDYPLLCYKGFFQDNRELVMVNLADKTQPQ